MQFPKNLTEAERKLTPLAGAVGIPARSLSWIHMWLHIALGWILITLILAALSGIIRKD